MHAIVALRLTKKTWTEEGFQKEGVTLVEAQHEVQGRDSWRA